MKVAKYSFEATIHYWKMESNLIQKGTLHGIHLFSFKIISEWKKPAASNYAGFSKSYPRKL